MAKCVGSVDQWKPKIVELEQPEFNVDNVRVGESLLNSRLEETFPLLLNIANDYIQIKQSALFDDFKLDCSQVQDALVTKLEKLQSDVSSVIHCISTSNLITSTKHRYFILFSYGIIERLQKLLQIVGRLSEIDQRLYNEEHRKLLISEESIAIHSLTSIWTAVIKIISDLCQSAHLVFNSDQQPQEYDFIGQLEFFTAHLQYTKILLMDMIITSWIKFNRLVKFDDLVNGLPFLCPCHCKVYFRTLQAASQNVKDTNLLNDMLPLILDHQSKPSMMTHSARRTGIVPQEPCFVGTSSIELAYFIVWHLYSLSRFVSNEQRPLVSSCRDILESSFEIAMSLFLPTSNHQVTSDGFRLSPNQEERFKLMFLMLNSWCEKNSNNLSLLIRAFSFIDKHWDLFGDKYFDRVGFTIGGLTMFQLFTKLFNEAIPIYTTDGAAAKNNERTATKDEQELTDIWNRYLNRVQPVANKKYNR